MDESDIWSVDRLAASTLLARLGLDTDANALTMAERQFGEHRATAMEWAAKRAHASVLEIMEEGSARYFPHEDEQWCAGYCRAQQQAAAMSIHDLLKLLPGKPASKGQILRRLVRRARQK